MKNNGFLLLGAHLRLGAYPPSLRAEKDSHTLKRGLHTSSFVVQPSGWVFAPNRRCALLLALAALLVAGCGKPATPPPAPAPDAGAKVAEANDPEFDEAPGLDEEGSREW